jgi:DNA adenine methylase
MGVPHPIPYQGSKRGLARTITSYFPQDPARLVEPFAGSAAVSLAAAYYGKADRFLLNDLNHALMALWDEIINQPASIADAYATLWKAQAGREREYYDLVRTQFNRTQRPDYLLYLLARCVKASVRYNAYGEFNQSPDNRRKGAHPDTMRGHIVGASRLLKSKMLFFFD